jgi:hypothetical protein
LARPEFPYEARSAKPLAGLARGELNFLIAEAREDRQRGPLKDWPTPQ